MLGNMLKRGTNNKGITLVLILMFFFACGIVWQVNPLQAAVLETDTIEPILVLEKIDAEDAVAGGEFTLSFIIRNLTNNPGFNSTLTFDVKGNDQSKGSYPFTVKPGQDLTIDSIKGGESRTVMVTFLVDAEAQNKDYELLIDLTTQDATFKKSVKATAGIKVPVTYDLTKPVLMVKEVKINPANPDILEGFTASFVVENLSKSTEARNVIFTLVGGDNFKVIDISNRKNIMRIGKGEQTVVTYQLKAKDTKTTNAVTLKMGFDYQANKEEAIEESINLPLPEEEMEIGTKPRVIVNKYTLSAEKVLAGNTVTLRLYIENTNQRAVKNVKISLGVIKIEDSATGTTTTGGTVFSPVNSSNSFFIDYIPGKTVLQKDIDLYVDPNAVAKTYIVPVDIEYEDRQGTNLTCEEQVNIPVTQECKLQIISTDVPPQCSVGEMIPVSAEFVNVGKVALGNFLVTVEGDFEKENGTYFVGNLEIGASDYYQGMIIPQKEGTLEGKVVFNYIDNNNKDVRVEQPFTVEVMAQQMPPKGMEGGMGPEMPGKPGMPMDGKSGAGGGFVNLLKTKGLTILLILVIVVEAFYILRMRRKRASEEFFNE
jgi:hypothetical protein